jgi:hypothetical protein
MAAKGQQRTRAAHAAARAKSNVMRCDMTDEIQTEDRLVTASLKLVLTALTIPRSSAILQRLGNAACNECRAS